MYTAPPSGRYATHGAGIFGSAQVAAEAEGSRDDVAGAADELALRVWPSFPRH